MLIRPLNIEFRLSNDLLRTTLDKIFNGNHSMLAGFVAGNLTESGRQKLITVLQKFPGKHHIVENDGSNQIEFYIEKSVLADKLNLTGNENPVIRELLKVYENYENYKSGTFGIGNRIYKMDKFHIMGIVNVTPDSFSDGGQFYTYESAISHGIEMYDNGVDFIDIGGESTRPGAEKVSTKEELRRVIPVIEGILAKRPDAVISVDTTKSEVARQALERGAKIINDISGLTFDDEMIDVAALYGAAVVIMHIKGTPQTMQNNPYYEDVIEEIYAFLDERIKTAEQAGIKDIIIDPGIGFGKRVKDNYEILARLDEFKGLGKPLLIGLSRKSFIGKALNLEVGKRDFATLISERLAIGKGAVIVRTHNYKKLIDAEKINYFIQNPNRVELNNV